MTLKYLLVGDPFPTRREHALVKPFLESTYMAKNMSGSRHEQCVTET
jgi:hypothetical protein